MDETVDEYPERDSGTIILSSVQICSSDSEDEQSSDNSHTSTISKSNFNPAEETAIRSVAVVKKSQIEFPVSFRKLQSNTDLKRPPSNWLRGQCIYQNYPPCKHSEFTSFIMGYQFPDCIGEVDIVSDAENIKKLLKMPYNPNAHMSMMVHRIGKTILIDEFDISQYILRQSEYQWKWLRKFFYEYVLESLPTKEMTVLVRPNKSRDAVQSKNLLSKFLHYSIKEEETVSSQPKVEHPAESPVSVTTISSPTKEEKSDLPLEETLPHPNEQPFTRNIIWNFEDLRMLIGTDLPIFGGTTHPCVSLRLKDMNKPINVLTGIDYWLDNLMCNVPEVIMCYHIDGIVKKYEFIKTEDLPRMADSQFSPQLVRDIAHNILSFLKSKATKEGHTYWLFKSASKEKKDAIVKLYDLTSLCSGKMRDLNDDVGSSYEEAEGNPFTVPVAMLFYCVAKNLWNSHDSSSRSPSIRALLDNALSLLQEEKHSKIVCHCHYILSDIYVPQHIDPISPHISDESEEEEDEEEDEEDEVDVFENELSSGSKEKEGSKKYNKKKNEEIPSIKVSSLCFPFVPKKVKQKIRPPKLTSDILRRCDSSLQHVIVAFKCIESHMKERPPAAPPENVADSPAKDGECEVLQEPRVAKQYEPIPMPYSPINKSKVPESKTKSGLETADEYTKSLSESSNQDNTYDRASASQKTEDAADTAVMAKYKDKVREPRSSLFSQTDKTSLVPKALLSDSVLNSYFNEASWNDKMKFRLLRKATLIFMTKAKLEFDNKNYGSCLRYAKLAMHSWACMGSFFSQDMNFPLPSQPLLIAGDTYYYLSKNWNIAPKYIEQFNSRTKEQEDMADIFESFISGQDCNWLIKIPCDAVESLKFSYTCYESALSTIKSSLDVVNLKKKLASVCNELSCIFMNQGNQICQELGQGLEAGGTLWDDSRFYLKKGLALFEEVDDKVNTALLHCNHGRLLRICAYHNSNKDEGQVYTSFVRHMHEEAFREYEIALDILKSKNISCSQLYDSVVWDYGTALFNYGTLLQDDSQFFEQDRTVVTKHITDLYDKALKFCDTKTPGKNLPLYQYRAAIIHMRLAGLYHELFRDSDGDKKLRHIAELNYSRSCCIFLQLDNMTDALKAHLDYVVFLEDVLKKLTGARSHWKLYLLVLKILLDCLPVLESAKENRTVKIDEKSCEKRSKKRTKEKRRCSDEEPSECKAEDSEADISLKQHLESYEKKLQSSLLAMMKLTKSSDKSINCFEGDMKSMYVFSLNKDRLHILTHLVQAISSIQPAFKKVNKH